MEEVSDDAVRGKRGHESRDALLPRKDMEVVRLGVVVLVEDENVKVTA